MKQAQHVQLELAATQDLLAANQRELQRNLMVMKFRNAEVERLRVCFAVSYTAETVKNHVPDCSETFTACLTYGGFHVATAC